MRIVNHENRRWIHIYIYSHTSTLWHVGITVLDVIRKIMYSYIEISSLENELFFYLLYCRNWFYFSSVSVIDLKVIEIRNYFTIQVRDNDYWRSIFSVFSLSASQRSLLNDVRGSRRFIFSWDTWRSQKLMILSVLLTQRTRRICYCDPVSLSLRGNYLSILFFLDFTM